MNTPAGPERELSTAERERVVALSKAGFRALHERQVDKAARYFTDILEVDPHNSYAEVGLGQVEIKRGNLSAALERALVDELAKLKQRTWLEDNRDSIARYNEHVEKRGVFGDDTRSF